MEHGFITDLAAALDLRGIGTLRYNFPYMEAGSRRPDSPALCHATVRAVVAEAHRRAPDVLLIAGGKSFGGRMTSQAQAADPLESVAGLAFIGFPLHPAKAPSNQRGAHLTKVNIPMLFLQGTRDELADLNLLSPLVEGLQPRATLRKIETADHSFHVLKRSGRTDPEVRDELADSLVNWITASTLR
jgi:predicted alpha/beta-hydrolase family hydrolase